MMDLKEHIVYAHAIEELFECAKCDEKFVSEHILKKRLQMQEKKVKFCHFYNNNKHCKYADLGCRFKHEKAPECKSQEKCKKKL